VTLTYFYTTTALATGVHVASNREVTADTAAPATDQSASTGSIASGASAIAHIFTSAAGQPNQAAWGSGTYRAQMEATSIGADTSYGFRTVGTADGHIARVNTGLTADLETATQAEAAFTGTGLKLGTVSWTPSAGAASDRLELVVAYTNAGSMAQSATMKYRADGQTFIDGPFDDGGGAAAVPYRMLLGVGT
jgi:hypothetical protein